AQGEGVSILTRAHLLTGKRHYLDLAVQAITPFHNSIAAGGVRSRLPDGSTFLEEYPEPEAHHVLNGYLYAIIGLLDLRRVGCTKAVDGLLIGADEALGNNIHLWDANGWSIYDLHNLNGGARNYCTAAYHNLHATQLQIVGEALGNDRVINMADKWSRSSRHPVRRLRAAAGKIAYRLRYPPQR
ncbi:MAG TPA: D-glucuronyl C5-epimerase family protein, partial [Nitrospira sp.]|nr:D-glucuronyl C5-epimerase family protein [Nitrospira sp.]